MSTLHHAVSHKNQKERRQKATALAYKTNLRYFTNKSVTEDGAGERFPQTALNEHKFIFATYMTPKCFTRDIYCALQFQ